MAKNRKFHDVYEISVEGITTNNFMSEVIHDYILGFIKAITLSHPKIKVELKEK